VADLWKKAMVPSGLPQKVAPFYRRKKKRDPRRRQWNKNNDIWIVFQTSNNLDAFEPIENAESQIQDSGHTQEARRKGMAQKLTSLRRIELMQSTCERFNLGGKLI